MTSLNPLSHTPTIDVFRKIDPEFSRSSRCGAGLSMVLTVLVVWMITSELSTYMSVRTVSDFVLDDDRFDVDTQSTLEIHWNVTFPRTPCDDVRVTFTNAMGVRSSSSKHLWKHRAREDSAQNLEILEKVYGEGELPSFEGETTPKTSSLSNAVILNDQSFREYVERHDVVLVNFYASWCFFSNQLAPLYDRVAEIVRNEKPYGEIVKVAKVNCAEYRNKALCRRNRIRGFPTVLRFVGGNIHRPEMFHGIRSLDRFLTFAEEGLEKKFPGRVAGLREKIMDEARKQQEQDDYEAKISNNMSSRDGCNLVGYIEVPRVPGHLHFISDTNSEDAASHVFHHLSFGPRLDSDFANTHLKDHRISMPEQRYVQGVSHEHYMKILPTRHWLSDQVAVESFRYTTNSHATTLKKNSNNNNDDDVKREVRITYDISPLVVEYRDETVPFYHFMTNLCAVIGGVYALIGFADMVVYYFSGVQREKVSLGKFT